MKQRIKNPKRSKIPVVPKLLTSQDEKNNKIDISKIVLRYFIISRNKVQHEY